MTPRGQAPLPIDAAIAEIVALAADRRRLVLVAPPGSGKTTRVPPALLRAGLLGVEAPEVVVLQPRRVAARAVAARIADENGWTLGEEAGYHVRFDRKVGPRTRLKVVTEGILNRQIVADPLLARVGAVVLDEFHERSIHTDLALALLREVADSVRDDMILIVMSATLDAAPVAAFLGDAPIVRVEGRAFPVDIQYEGRSGERPAERMAHAIERWIADRPSAGRGGDLLAFLPGGDEIRRVGRSIAASAERAGLDVLPLHGSLTADEQDRAIRPGKRPRIVLATNIAETSLTIEGVSTVIDSGLARQASFDAARGIDRLELERISRASAAQRAGRAGRTGPGACIRLWSEREQAGMPASDLAEIHRVDLAPALLSIHAWGFADPTRFGWFEAPGADRLAAADLVLARLDAIDSAGAVTATGRRLLEIPASPRLARLLVEASGRGVLREAATVAAILSERDFVVRGAPADRANRRERSDVLDRLDRFAELESARFHPSLRDAGLDPIAGRRIAQSRDDFLRAARGWRQAAACVDRDEIDEILLKLLVLAFPDRVCRRREGDLAAGVMVGGRGVRLDRDSVARTGEFFLAIDPRDDPKSPVREARVRIASEVRAEWLPELFPDAVVRERVAEFDRDRGRVVGVHRVSFLGLTLAESPHAAVDPALAHAVLANELRGRGLALVRENEAAAAWLARYELVAAAMPEAGLPPIDDAAVAPLIAEACRGKQSVDDVRKAPWVELLKGRLTYAESRLIDDQAPEALVVPSGNRIRLTYEPGKPPVLAARLQELFGWTETPRVAGGRIGVVLHLLGPNFRPVQVTDDLASFWASAYFQVRKDLRNRYPKHAWPEDPLAARAEARGGGGGRRR